MNDKTRLVAPGEEYAGLGVTREEFDWLADQGYFEPPEIAAEISDDDRRFAFSAEGKYLALCVQATGAAVADEKVREVRARAAELLSQSHAIAAKLESQKSTAYRNTPFGLFRYYPLSRHVEKLPCFRRILLIPAVACQVRAPMLAALEAFLERNLFARFFTFTSGKRTPLHEVRRRARWLHRKLSELAAQPFMREAGCRIVFRSTELGTPETANDNSAGGMIERDEDGHLCFHVHAHCVATLDRYLEPDKWAQLLGSIHGFWPHAWNEGGQIRDARECCKYITKPGEMLKLSGEELCELQRQLYRVKLAQPMGALADEIKARKANRFRLNKTHTPEGWVYQEGPNWNAHARRTRLEKAADAVARFTRGQGSGSARVVCRLPPGFGPSGIKEPRVVIMATTWDENAVRTHPLVAALIARHETAFRDAWAIKVHVCTSTVGESRAFGFVQNETPPRHVLTAAEAQGMTR